MLVALLILTIVIGTVGCDDGDGTPTPTVTSTPETTSTPTPTPLHTPSPTPEPTPTAILSPSPPPPSTEHIIAWDPVASEDGPDNGGFTVYTKTCLPGGLCADGWAKIAYTVSGTAQHGIDYEELPGFVWAVVGYPIGPSPPPGEPIEIIDIVPIQDDLVEGNETVIITLGGGQSAEVVITDAMPAPEPSSTLSVHFIDVGQGDAILLDLGETEVLIDGGKNTSSVISSLSSSLGQHVDGHLEAYWAQASCHRTIL